MKLQIAIALTVLCQSASAEMTPIMPQQYGQVQPIPYNRTTQSPTVLERWGSQMDALQVQRGAPQPYQYKAPSYDPQEQMKQWLND
jgi:hypothetical protein